MRLALATNWWSLVIRGILGIIVGVISFAWPAITLAALVFLFGAYALFDGVVNIVGAVHAMERHERWAPMVLEGIVGIAAAVVTVAWPPVTAIALVYIVAAWAVVTGALKIAAAIRLRRYVAGEWLLVLSGVFSLLLGFLLAASPLTGALILALWVGAYWFVFGVLFVALGLRLRSWGGGSTARGHIPAPAH